jgi:hypothetical protein
MSRSESLHLKCVAIAICILSMIRCALERHLNFVPIINPSMYHIRRSVRGGFDLEKSLAAELDPFPCLTHCQTTIHISS